MRASGQNNRGSKAVLAARCAVGSARPADTWLWIAVETRVAHILMNIGSCFEFGRVNVCSHL
jgi:hypothetical protein